MNKLTLLRADLASRFPERMNVTDGALAAVLAGEHVLLLGPPGTAKSALARAVAQAFGGTYFERLLTKFSTPEELFGSISLKALEQDRFARVTTGKLPEVECAFVDEVFKANSAILNSMLTLVNERVFHNDGVPVTCPLVTLFGASNELPESKDLEALSDRFLLRYDVGYLLRPSNLKTVLLATDPVAPPAMKKLQGPRSLAANRSALDLVARRWGRDRRRRHRLLSRLGQDREAPRTSSPRSPRPSATHGPACSRSRYSRGTGPLDRRHGRRGLVRVALAGRGCAELASWPAFVQDEADVPTCAYPAGVKHSGV